MDSIVLWGPWEVWGILVLVSLATYLWRGGGVVIAQHIKPDGDLSQWFSCVAYGMLAGLISRILVLPVGILAETPLMDRLVALAAGFMMFFAFKRTMLPGMISAVSVFVVLAASRANGIF
ncbi:MAG: AzlD domain-containing protein [Proteobacteria bacterium]|nr:AzlD domain-containing protein [Pseudomonadota bacterium]